MKHSTVVPWHVRLFGSSPWQGSVRKAVLAVALLVVAGSIASIFYSRNVDAQERRFAAGVAAMRGYDYKAAKAILTRTTKSDPSNAQAFYELGNAHWMLGEGPEAAEAWSAALLLDPTMARAYIARGIQESNTGNLAASLNDFKKAVSLKPSMEVYLQQGMALQKLGRHEEAMASFDEATKFASSDDRREIETASNASRKALKLPKPKHPRKKKR